MATTIKLKNGSGAPLAGDLVAGEPALDLTNKRLYTEDSGGTVIEVGTNPTSLTTGSITSTDDLSVTGVATIGADAGGEANVLTLKGRTSDNDGYIKFTSSDGATAYAYAGVPAANTFAVYTNGFNERMRIDSSGNVGIGTASVSGVTNTVPIVSVYGGTSKNTQFILEGDSGAQFVSLLSGQSAGNLPSLFFNNGLRFATATDKSATGYSERMRITSSGNVGIGTASPANNSLTIEKTGTARLRLSEAGVRSWDIEATSGSWRVNNATNSIEAMRIDLNGNVGIGTSSPDALVTLNAPNYTSTATGGMIKWKNTNNSGHSNVQGYFVSGQGTDLNIGANAYINTSGSWARWSSGLATSAVSCSRTGAINFITNTSSGDGLTRMTIDSSGNVGIGTASPDGSDWNASSKLLHLFQNDVNGVLLKLESSSTTGFLSAGNNQLQIGTLEAQPFKFYTSSTERMRIDSSGNLNIGTTTTDLYSISTGSGGMSWNSGQDSLSIAHDCSSAFSPVYINKFNFVGGTSNTRYINWYSNGGSIASITYDGTTFTYGTPSDARLKENIEDSSSAIPVLNALKIRKYDWKDSKVHQEFGFIAQELEEVCARAVIPPQEEDEYYGVDEGKLVPMLAKAIQEQQAMIEELKAEVATLKGA